MRKLITTIAFLVATGATLVAQDEVAAVTATPARFVEGDGSLSSLIEFPDIAFDMEITLMCNGHATAKGRLKSGQCSSPDDPDLLFTMAVSRVFNAVRLVPATVAGKKEQVDFQFAVIFRKVADDESVEIFMNNQKNVERLGRNYISAQRYSPHPFPSRCTGWRQDDLIVEAAIVDATGQPKDANTQSSAAKMPARCRTGILNQLMDARWIPAMHNGQFVESVWVNPIVLATVPYKRQQ